VHAKCGPFTADLPAGGDATMAQVFIASPRDGGTTHLASAWVDTQSVPSTWQGGETIRITAPLAGAALSGHVTVTGAAGPTVEQALLVQVYDADGLLIGQSSGTISAELGRGGPFSIEVAFAAKGAGPGRVVVLSDSPRNGAVMHLASVEVAIVP